MKDQIAGSLSRPKLINLLAGLIVFFAATQLGLHFWPESALVYGIRIDYLAPTLYFLDILIIIYLLINKLENLRIYDLKLIVPILLTNLLFSLNPLATLSWSLHFLAYLIFTISLSLASSTALRRGLIAALCFQGILAATQVIFGHNVGGILYWFGERAVSVGQPNVASAQVFGVTMLRTYATFSHPNVLAGWLVVSLIILPHLRPKAFVLATAAALTIFGVLLTQSRSALLTLFGLIIPLTLLHPKLRLPYYVGVLVFCFFCSTFLFMPARAELSSSERLGLQAVSLKVVSAFPVFGAGGGAAITTYPSVSPNWRLLQPDHNSSTLLLSWFGLFGTLAILAALRPNIGSLKSLLLLSPLLLLDHYFLTSPQGLFILVLYGRLSWMKNRSVH